MEKSKKGLLIKEGLKQASDFCRERVGGRRGRLGSDAAPSVRHLPNQNQHGGVVRDG
ncbi:unnamed protein product [Brassica oleracea var. botrytis]|uniref:Uncharacterized protein n=3 Tax=Brassica TaxID=3705 RepID=A0A0D3ASG0_BRAOL|nr:unnamed protein product [Brassica napus]CDY69203.1 BnaCnng62370D [Brassica napus]VDD24145.1 unnamed protein product [Brassica oleracea]